MNSQSILHNLLVSWGLHHFFWRNPKKALSRLLFQIGGLGISFSIVVVIVVFVVIIKKICAQLTNFRCNLELSH